VLAHHLRHVALVEGGLTDAVEAVEDLLVRSQQDGAGIGRLLGSGRQLLVRLRVLGHHPLAEIPNHLAGPLLLRQLPELHLKQAEAPGRLHEAAVRRQRRVLRGGLRYRRREVGHGGE
jgi:hypothetical protein